MKFEEVLPALKAGKKIRRRTWCKDTYIYINYCGRIVTQSGSHYDIILNGLYDLKHDGWEIVTEKKKVKLRDLTEEQYDLWVENNCANHEVSCRDCPFQKVQCDNHESINDAWYLNKDLYSDKFLDQEVEIED